MMRKPFYMTDEIKHGIIKLAVSAVFFAAALIISGAFPFSVYLKLFLFIIPYLTAGFSVLKEAAENIAKGEIFDENFLMCIASIGAFIIGEYPEAVFVMIFFGVGELLEDIASEKNHRTVKALLDIRPDTATVIKDGCEYVTDAKQVNIGDTIKIVAGERIPLDCVILKGSTSVDNSAVTGESLPQAVLCGDAIYSGCINLSGVVEARVIKTYGESTASKILELVERSAEKKSQSERFIHKFAAIYTPLVCFCAVLLAVIPSLIWGDVAKYIYRALMFLVVSCPCALVVSVPLAYFSGVASAAKKGILIKGSQYLEALTAVKTVLFDKTGTLTKGDFKVTAIHPEKISEKELLKIAAIAESAGTHPISVFLCAAYLKENIYEKASINNKKEFAGEGVYAEIDGAETVVGNAEMMKRFGIAYRECSVSGTIIHIAQNGEYSGHIVIGDSVKPTSKKVIELLKERGIKSVMVTGDKHSAAESVAKAVGTDEFYAELKPEGKIKTLEKYLLDKSKTAFVGDGINDAPVLTRADVGIAMGAIGSDAAVEAADIVLMEDEPTAVYTAIKTASKTQRIVTENIIFSVTVKLAILLLGAFGFANMWMASLGDVGVLLIAVLNSFRAFKLK